MIHTYYSTHKQKNIIKSKQKHHTKQTSNKKANNETTVATVMMVVLSLRTFAGQETTNTLLINKTNVLQHSQTDKPEKSKQKHHTNIGKSIII